MKITHYKLVSHRAEDMDEKVTALIQEGWQPFGGPFVIPTPELEQVDTVYQAMVKYAGG